MPTFSLSQSALSSGVNRWFFSINYTTADPSIYYHPATGINKTIISDFTNNIKGIEGFYRALYLLVQSLDDGKIVSEQSARNIVQLFYRSVDTSHNFDEEKFRNSVKIKLVTELHEEKEISMAVIQCRDVC